MVRSSRFVHTDELITRNTNFKISYRIRTTPTSHVKITRQSEEQSTADAVNVRHIWQILEIPSRRKKINSDIIVSISISESEICHFFFFLIMILRLPL